MGWKAVWFALVVFLVAAKGDRVTISTLLGRFIGLSERVSAGQVLSFKGIQYALAPIDELRWMPPVPFPYSGFETFDATRFKPSCMQPSVPWYSDIQGGFDEDCLYLNVFVPMGAVPSAPLPVIVVFHGGGFVSGSPSQLSLDPRLLSLNVNAVVVSIAYRLGPFGFLALNDLASESGVSGNYGIQDQELALTWVFRNIAAFGGDSSSVTLFGESAGGTSVCAHLIRGYWKSPRPVYKGAIISSAACERPILYNQRDGLVRGELFADAMGCGNNTNSSKVSCLRRLSRTRIVNCLSGTSGSTLDGGYLDATDLSFWYPTLWPGYWPDNVWAKFAQGQFLQVPVMIGSTLEEYGFVLKYAYASSWTATTISDYSSMEAAVIASSNSTLNPPGVDLRWNADAIARVSVLYTNASWFEKLRYILSDDWLSCAVQENVHILTNFSVPVYWFLFDVAILPSQVDMQCGICHTVDLPFLFGVNLWLSSPGSTVPFTPQQEKAAAALQQSIYKFIRGAAPWAQATSPDGPVFSPSSLSVRLFARTAQCKIIAELPKSPPTVPPDSLLQNFSICSLNLAMALAPHAFLLVCLMSFAMF